MDLRNLKITAAAILLRGELVHIPIRESELAPWGLVLDVAQTTFPDMRELLGWAEPTVEEASQYVTVRIWNVMEGKNERVVLLKKAVYDVLPAPTIAEEILPYDASRDDAHRVTRHASRDVLHASCDASTKPRDNFPK